jgi:hypothetical protein
MLLPGNGWHVPSPHHGCPAFTWQYSHAALAVTAIAREAINNTTMRIVMIIPPSTSVEESHDCGNPNSGRV